MERSSLSISSRQGMIYILEDSKSIRDLIAYTLSHQNYGVQSFERPSQMKQALKEAQAEDRPDLFLLDIMLPEEDGIQVLKELRESPFYKDAGIIMLTAKDSEFDRVLGLDEGADDYLGKPFGMTELLSRIRAVLRRTSKTFKNSSSQGQAGLITKAGITIDEPKALAFLGDQVIDLTLKEYELLRYLMVNEGAVQSRDKLLTEIWGYDYVGESRTIDVHIASLRQKLGPAAPAIRTVRGWGYRFLAQEDPQSKA